MSSATLFSRLSVMMLLQYAVLGAWFATVGLVLSSYGLASIIGFTFSLGALGAIASPLLLGAIADRFFPSQRVLGALHIVGGALLLCLPGIVAAGNGTVFLGVVFVYMLLFQPTVALSNTIAFTHLGARRRIFPWLRVFGTVGWIVVGLVVGQLGWSAETTIFLVAAVCSLALGVYSFTLPSTPPPLRGTRFSWGDVVAAKAFGLLRQRNVLVFMICAILTCIPIAMYNAYASTYLSVVGVDNVASVLVVGQASELVFIVLLPFLLSWLSMKWVLVIGMVTWALRFGLFMTAADGSLAPVIIAVALHGICNDFFLIVGFMYMDKVAPDAIKAQAQSFFVFVSQGVGTFVGSLAAGEVFNAIVVDPAAPGQWVALWTVPVVIAIVSGALFSVMFRSRDEREPRDAARTVG